MAPKEGGKTNEILIQFGLAFDECGKRALASAGGGFVMS